MKKIILGIASLALLIGLFSCNSKDNSSNDSINDSTSGKPGTEFPDKGTMTYSEVISLLETAMVDEALYASNAKIKNIDYSGALTTVSEENLEIYSNYSSYSVGTVKRIADNGEILSDNFVRRAMTVNEKFEVEGQINNYTMFERVVDYENDVMTRNTYQDSAEKLFVVETQEEADRAGLSEGSYILLGAYPIETSAQAVYNTRIFVATLATSIYISQLGKTSIDYEKDTDGNYVFSFEADYSYPGDWGGDKIYEELKLDFVLSSDRSKLLTTKYTYTMNDVMENDPDDSYLSGYTWEATLSYNSRHDVPANTISTSEYFLETVEDIQLIARINGDQKVETNNIPSNASYIFADAKTYTPSKALGLRLSNAKSSNSSVVKLESDGLFKIVGEGKTTLTFSYFKKGDDGVYRYEEIEEAITISAPTPTSVSFSYNFDVVENTLLSGETYTWGTYVSPTKANPNIIATSDHPEIISVTVDANNNLTLVAHAAGEATITIASAFDTSITASKTLTVMDGTLDFNQIISSKTYSYYAKNLFSEYTFTMTFDGNGNGERVQRDLGTGEEYIDTFTYEVEKNKIHFTSWSKGTPQVYKFETGIIVADGNKISCDEPVNYGTFLFEAK